jgi:hypothetical protein
MERNGRWMALVIDEMRLPVGGGTSVTEAVAGRPLVEGVPLALASGSLIILGTRKKSQKSRLSSTPRRLRMVIMTGVAVVVVGE